MGVVAKIPIIDISGGGEQLEVARELVDAAVEHGFIYIKSTGEDFPVEVIQNAFNMVTFEDIDFGRSGTLIHAVQKALRSTS